MSWVSNFLKGLVAFAVPQYDSTTGTFYVNGVAVTGLAKYTWAQLSGGTINPANFSGVPILIIDAHSSPTLKGGSLWVGDASAPAGWALWSNPLCYATFDLAPNPATWPGLRIRVLSGAGLGGADMISNGTIYRYANRCPVALASVSQWTHPALMTDYLIGMQAAIPINNGKSLLQAGDEILMRWNLSKNGATDTHYLDVLVGPNGTITTGGVTSDISVEGGGRTFSNTNIGDDEIFNINCLSATSIIKETPLGSSGFLGSNNTTRSTAKTISSLDSAISYVSLVLRLTGTTNVQKLEKGIIQINHCS